MTNQDALRIADTETWPKHFEAIEAFNRLLIHAKLTLLVAEETDEAVKATLIASLKHNELTWQQIEHAEKGMRDIEACTQTMRLYR